MSPQKIPGSPEDRSIGGFCIRKGMSKASFYRQPQAVCDALVTVYGPRTLRITEEAEAEWDRARAKPTSTEQRLLKKMQAKRVAQARNAARVSSASPRHVSQKRKRRAEPHRNNTATRSQ
jgi:hypothetical protein